MSNEQYVHFGAYLEVEMKADSKDYYTYECRNHKDIRYSDSTVKFCSKCGKRLKKVKHTEDEYKSYWEISDEDETLTEIDVGLSNEKMILISNMTGDSTHISLDNSDFGVYDVQDHNFYITNMYRKYGERIKKLANNEFVNAVTYKCGILVYWS